MLKKPKDNIQEIYNQIRIDRKKTIIRLCIGSIICFLISAVLVVLFVFSLKWAKSAESDSLNWLHAGSMILAGMSFIFGLVFPIARIRMHSHKNSFLIREDEIYIATKDEGKAIKFDDIKLLSINLLNISYAEEVRGKGFTQDRGFGKPLFYKSGTSVREAKRTLSSGRKTVFSLIILNNDQRIEGMFMPLLKLPTIPKTDKLNNLGDIEIGRKLN